MDTFRTFHYFVTLMMMQWSVVTGSTKCNSQTVPIGEYVSTPCLQFRRGDLNVFRLSVIQNAMDFIYILFVFLYSLVLNAISIGLIS